nr:MAG TPA: hypothetical protein [Caudoviricetes sp.]
MPALAEGAHLFRQGFFAFGEGGDAVLDVEPFGDQAVQSDRLAGVRVHSCRAFLCCLQGHGAVVGRVPRLPVWIFRGQVSWWMGCPHHEQSRSQWRVTALSCWRRSSRGRIAALWTSPPPPKEPVGCGDGEGVGLPDVGVEAVEPSGLLLGALAAVGLPGGEAVDEGLPDGGVVRPGAVAVVEFHVAPVHEFRFPAGGPGEDLQEAPDPHARLEHLPAHGHAVGGDHFDAGLGADGVLVGQQPVAQFPVGEFLVVDGEAGFGADEGVGGVLVPGVDAEDVFGGCGGHGSSFHSSRAFRAASAVSHGHVWQQVVQ